MLVAAAGVLVLSCALAVARESAAAEKTSTADSNRMNKAERRMGIINDDEYKGCGCDNTIVEHNNADVSLKLIQQKS